MKKNLSILFAFALIFTFVFILSSCGNSSCEVNFIVDGEVYNTVATSGKESVTLPENPAKEGYKFEGWYRDIDTWEEPFNETSLLNTSITKDINVYAKFEASYDSGNLICSPSDTGCTLIGVKDNTVSEIFIPAYVTEINTGAFASCANLTSIEVEQNNENYRSVDGNLYDINCTKLIKYAVAKKDTAFTVPDTVTSIGNSAFSSCTSLMTVTIPSSVTSIDYYAFLSCYKLFEVINHSSLKISKGSKNYGLIAQNALEVHNSSESKIVNSNGYLFYKSGNGNYLIGYSGNDTDITLPQNYRNENYAISNYAFYNCTNLKSVKIPDSVISIGESAFQNCSSLESLTIPFVGASKDETSKTHFGYIFGASSDYYNDDYVPSTLKTVVITNDNNIGAYAFSYCLTLKSITLPNSITSIGEAAFQCCKNLTDITIPDTITSIGNSAFRYCSALTDIALPDSITYISSSMFDGCTALTGITLPESIIYIEERAFGDCSGLTSVTLPNGIKNIKVSAFIGCSGLTSINLPDGLIHIGEYAFSGCSSLTSITLPENLESIHNAFNDCSNLIYNEYDNAYYLGNSTNPYFVLVKAKSPSITSCDIHKNTKFIHGNAFKDCISLTNITVPDSVTDISFAAFEGCCGLESISIPSFENNLGYIFGENDNRNLPSNLKTVVITNAYDFDNNAFSNCSNLENIVINEGVTEFQLYLFLNCTSLKSITIPDTVTVIGNGIFYDCTSLESILIPDSVKTIGDYAFYGCSSLKNVTIPNSVTSIGSYVFYGCSSLKNVTIPNSVTSIGNFVFDECPSLVYNEYDNSYYLGNDTNPYLILVKSKNTSITSCNIHKNTKFIHSNAFENCISLTSIAIPNSVKQIGNFAFLGCIVLKNVTFDDTAGWKADLTLISSAELSDRSIAAKYLNDMYYCYTWKRT